MTTKKDIQYKGTNDPRHSFDLYIPKTKSESIVIFVHGGAWISGSKSDFQKLGKGLQSRGIMTAIVEYRLSTKEDNQVVHPMHTQDIADSLSWIHDHINELVGYTPKNVYLVGHSAGAHLIGLIAQQDYVSSSIKSWVKGLIMVEGIYDIERLAKLYPTYIDWFLIHAFPDQKTWKECSLYTKPLDVKYHLVHSKEDELVCESHCIGFLEFLKQQGADVEYHQLMGSHDGVLEVDTTYDLISSIVNSSQ